MFDYPIDHERTSLLIGALTLLVLAVYAWDTRQIKKAAIEQSEAVQKPCVAIWITQDASAEMEDAAPAMMAFPPPTALRNGRLVLSPGETVRLVNIGTGPALNLYFEFTSRGADGPVKSAFGPHLAPNQDFDTGLSPQALAEDAEYFASFQSLSSTAYESRALIKERYKVMNLRFRPVRRTHLPSLWAWLRGEESAVRSSPSPRRSSGKYRS